MKRILAICCFLLCLCGCQQKTNTTYVAATTLPVYEFTAALCEGTGIQVARLITENVSCLHDYTLQVSQMRAMEGAQLTVISGAGLEDFLDDVLAASSKIVDASAGISIIHSDHEHHDDHEHDHAHHNDPHYWLSPANAIIMANNICAALKESFPQYTERFSDNCQALEQKLLALQTYGENTLKNLSCRDLITFHDGFSYFAASFDLTILKAMEEESGSEASAGELIELIELVKENELPAIFTEENGSDAAATIVSRETGVPVFQLNMAMAGDSYFDAMYHNINTIKEAME